MRAILNRVRTIGFHGGATIDRFHLLATPALVTLLSIMFDLADVRAASMLSPTAVLGTDLGEFSPDTVVVNMINQSGLDKPFVSGVTDFDTYFTTGDPAFAQANFLNNWQSEVSFTLPVAGTVDFDFGEIYSIDRLAIWNIALKDIKIHTSATSITTLQEVASFALPNHLHFPFSYVHDLLNLGAARDVRFLRIEIDSVHLFDPLDTFGYAIVGELVASAVPAAADVDGDYNDNGTVDAADYIVWRDTLNQVGPGLAADGDNDDAVDPDDYDVWAMHFGEAGAGTSSSAALANVVPEPASIYLIAAAAAGAMWICRRRVFECLAVRRRRAPCRRHLESAGVERGTRENGGS